jgi:hypothetical protein
VKQKYCLSCLLFQTSSRLANSLSFGKAVIDLLTCHGMAGQPQNEHIILVGGFDLLLLLLLLLLAVLWC